MRENNIKMNFKEFGLVKVWFISKQSPKMRFGELKNTVFNAG
jgi:hypothetical protein